MSDHNDQERRKKTETGTSRGTTADSDTIASASRRDFLRSAGEAGALSAAASLGLGGLLTAPAEAKGKRPRPVSLRPHRRRIDSYRIRIEAARSHLREAYPRQQDNGDERRYDDKRASFFKCLPQDDLGEVDRDAYAELLRALRTGDPVDFKTIPLSYKADRRLANPQGAYAFDLTSRDSWATLIPPAPRFDSAEIAAEIGEVYWQALTREVPFIEFSSNDLVEQALEDLNHSFSDIRAPIDHWTGAVGAQTLFRGGLPGDLAGPYLSQFLWLPVPYGPSTIVQRYPVPASWEDFMTDYEEWLAIQRGAAPSRQLTFDGPPRYLYNGRALGEYVHTDAVFQAYFNAALIINDLGPDALDPANPYLKSTNQGGFVTFGTAHLFDMVTKAARIGLEAAWFHKWLVHRRLRAEVFAGRIENQLNGNKDYGIHPDILDSAAVERLLDTHGKALLPQAYPEGSPTHPSYPAGHSTVAGACATVLKAFVDEEYVIENPVQASADGLSLEPWSDEALTFGGEINKLATNISIGRCTAGVHYRSDGEGLFAGEAMAIGLLQDDSLTYNEDFEGFTLTRFDGVRIRIVDGEVKTI